MKIIVAGLLVCGLWGTAGAQFAGKLTYKIVQSNSDVLTMVYYQSGNNARVDARSTAGADSTQVINTQDTILFDIAARKMTKMQYKTGMAFIVPNTATLALSVLTKSTVTVQTVGAENVNGYPCTHYTLIGQTGKLVSKRELWITASLGNPGVQVAGGYLYLTAEHPQTVKLAEAGATGVVVKSVVTGPGLHTEMNLVAVDTKRLAPSIFKVPAWYTVVDRSNIAIPTQ